MGRCLSVPGALASFRAVAGGIATRRHGDLRAPDRREDALLGTFVFHALVPFCFGPVFRPSHSTHKCILLNYMTPNMTLSYRPNLPELN
jgi:hypothetical protein